MLTSPHRELYAKKNTINNLRPYERKHPMTTRNDMIPLLPLSSSQAQLSTCGNTYRLPTEDTEGQKKYAQNLLESRAVLTDRNLEHEIRRLQRIAHAKARQCANIEKTLTRDKERLEDKLRDSQQLIDLLERQLKGSLQLASMLDSKLQQELQKSRITTNQEMESLSRKTMLTSRISGDLTTHEILDIKLERLCQMEKLERLSAQQLRMMIERVREISPEAIKTSRQRQNRLKKSNLVRSCQRSSKSEEKDENDCSSPIRQELYIRQSESDSIIQQIDPEQNFTELTRRLLEQLATQNSQIRALTEANMEMSREICELMSQNSNLSMEKHTLQIELSQKKIQMSDLEKELHSLKKNHNQKRLQEEINKLKEQLLEAQSSFYYLLYRHKENNQTPFMIPMNTDQPVSLNMAIIEDLIRYHLPSQDYDPMVGEAVKEFLQSIGKKYSLGSIAEEIEGLLKNLRLYLDKTFQNAEILETRVMMFVEAAKNLTNDEQP